MIEAILAGEFGGLVTLEAIGKSLTAIGNRPALPTSSVLQAERDKLEAMSDLELALRHQAHLRRRAAAEVSAEAQKKAKDIAQATAREAAQFYNHADAQADFVHWSKAEYWTFNEAIALLLGKSPKVLTPEKVRQEILAVETGFFLGSRPPVPAFLRQYENLYDLARRAQAMNKERLHPAVALVWARNTGAVEPPAVLVQLLEDRAKIELGVRRASSTPAAVVTVADQSLPDAATSEQVRNGRDWTPAALADLQTFRDAHTADQTAKHFGISKGRIRQLLIRRRETPAEPTAHSPFGVRLK